MGSIPSCYVEVTISRGSDRSGESVNRETYKKKKSYIQRSATTRWASRQWSLGRF